MKKNTLLCVCLAAAMSLTAVSLPCAESSAAGYYLIEEPASSTYSGGLTKLDGKLYYFNSDGSFAKGWKTVDGDRYYFGKDGAAVTKNTVINGKRYKFASNGKYRGVYTGFTTSGGRKFYYKGGILQTGFFTVKGKTYYAAYNGAIRTGWVKTGLGKDNVYYFDENGVWDGKTYSSGYAPAALGDFLLDFPYPDAIRYEMAKGYSGKYTEFYSIDYITAMLSDYSSAKLIPDVLTSDDEIDMGLPYPNKNILMLRSHTKTSASDKMPFVQFSKDEDGNVYVYFPNFGFGCCLGVCDVYDDILECYEDDNASADYGFDEYGDILE